MRIDIAQQDEQSAADRRWAQAQARFPMQRCAKPAPQPKTNAPDGPIPRSCQDESNRHPATAAMNVSCQKLATRHPVICLWGNASRRLRHRSRRPLKSQHSHSMTHGVLAMMASFIAAVRSPFVPDFYQSRSVPNGATSPWCPNEACRSCSHAELLSGPVCLSQR